MILLFILLSLSSFSQCDYPPTRNGNSSIVSANDYIYIDGVPCNQIGNSSNYNCAGINLDTSLIVQDGSCFWIITNGDWSNPVLLPPLSINHLSATVYPIDNCIMLQIESENANQYYIQGSFDAIIFYPIETTCEILIKVPNYPYYKIDELSVDGYIISTCIVSQIYIPSISHVSQGMYIINRKKVIFF